jgi:hypothetical protein
MKRLITISILALFLFSSVQAQIKKVAVLEPLGNFSMIQKAILRAKLAETLTNSGTFEAFARNYSEYDLECITQIIDENKTLLVECSLVEQESGNVVTTVTQHLTSHPITEFEKDCVHLALKLVWWSSVGTTSQISHIENPHNGNLYCPDGIELVYVEGIDSGNMIINSFFIGKFEVTQAQWKAIMGNNYSHFEGDNLPVENVSWYDIQAFLVKLNAVTDRNYRLPTEEEWEFAARGGTVGEGYMYSGNDNINSVAWYFDNSGNNTVKRKYENGKRMKYTEYIGRRTHPVGTKKPNELGIFDMTGNVWEWCKDWYDDSQMYRAARGGGWDNNDHFCRLSMRTPIFPNNRDSRLGFRVVLSVK